MLAHSLSRSFSDLYLLYFFKVVTLAVYTFFLSCLMGRQYLDNGQLGDMYFPFFTFLQFVFYIGWLKVKDVFCQQLWGHHGSLVDSSPFVRRVVGSNRALAAT